MEADSLSWSSGGSVIIIKVLSSGNDHKLSLNLPGVLCFVSLDQGSVKRDYSMD